MTDDVVILPVFAVTVEDIKMWLDQTIMWLVQQFYFLRINTGSVIGLGIVLLILWTVLLISGPIEIGKLKVTLNFQSYLNQWKKIFQFTGKSSPEEYLNYIFVNLICTLVIGIASLLTDLITPLIEEALNFFSFNLSTDSSISLSLVSLPEYIFNFLTFFVFLSLTYRLLKGVQYRNFSFVLLALFPGLINLLVQNPSFSISNSFRINDFTYVLGINYPEMFAAFMILIYFRRVKMIKNNDPNFFPFLSNRLTTSYGHFWTRAFDFKGKTSRSEYWLVIFIYYILYGFVYLINTKFVLPYVVLCTLPSCSIIIRRLRDAGKSWQWIFINFIPIAGVIWFLIILCRPSRSMNQLRSITVPALQEERQKIDDMPEQLGKLKAMLDEGVISNEEYEAMRKKSLGL